jgi:THO complex subunit 4
LKSANGIQIDGKPIKVEVILDAARAAAIPPPKGLSERVTTPKSQPKSAANTKVVAATNGRGGKGKQRGSGRPRNARTTKKTAEQLDSEMADYWQSGAATEGGEAAATGGAAPAANGDAPMDDEIL